MVASAVFITDLQGKVIISRNYRGDVPLSKAIDQFQNYLTDVEEEAKKPVFHVDTNGEISVGEDVGANGVGGEHFVYVSVSTTYTYTVPLNLGACRSMKCFSFSKN
jgi:AP-1 complex subunit mu